MFKAKNLEKPRNLELNPEIQKKTWVNMDFWIF